MRVGLNLLFLVPGQTGGVETYTRGLVPELARALGPEALTLFASPELAAELAKTPWHEGLRYERLPVSGRSRVPRTAYELLGLAARVRRARIDVLHNLHTITPLLTGARRTVTTIHDLLYLHHPDTHAPLLRRGMQLLVPVSARRSDRVLTVSRASRDDLVDSLGVPREKIDVAHSGPGLAGSTTPTPEDELRWRLDLGDRRLLLSPSARRAHKNLPRLLEAFAAAEQAREALLVLPGYETGAEDELAGHAAELGIAERVRCAGWVSDEDLLGLYAAATALVFPSLAEGFGLPILEAMSAGLPVACSNTSSLPEIAGDAALLFDPTSVDAMTGAIDRILSNGPLREDLRERGRRQAARFTWAAAAEQTIASYRRALAAA